MFLDDMRVIGVNNASASAITPTKEKSSKKGMVKRASYQICGSYSICATKDILNYATTPII